MDITLIDKLFEEASKVLNLDSSHDSIRQKVQAAISAKHRVDNAGSDSSSYYDTPYVRDVFGSEDAGQVVHSKSGKMTLSDYKKSKDGMGYDLSNHKMVKHAYVVTKGDDEKNESMTLILGGHEVMVQETVAHFTEAGEMLELQESAKSATAKVTLISAGKGSMGYYTEAALKKAAKDKIFDTGTPMFLNHQTMEERMARPEGDITKRTGQLLSPAEYVEGSDGKPGRLVATTSVYSHYKDFLSEVKDDTGVSVRVKAIPNGMKEGVPLVESILGSISADFVTKAGRGGRIEEMYESFRVTHPGRGNQPQESEVTDEEKKLLKDLQESNAKLATRLDRVQEQNQRLLAESSLNAALATSGLQPRGQNRVRTMVLANLPMTTDGALDTAKFEESVKATIKDEIAYLQESGVQTGPKLVRGLGVVPTTDKEGKELSEADVEKQANDILQESVGSLLGKEKKA